MKKSLKIGLIVVGVVILLLVVFGGVSFLYNLSQSNSGFLGELFVWGPDNPSPAQPWRGGNGGDGDDGPADPNSLSLVIIKHLS